MNHSGALTVVFAKAPQAGRVKTRLTAAIGAHEAARLHARLLDRTIATARAAGCGTVELHGSPAGHAWMRALARRHSIGLREQAQGDLGKRMGAALRSGLRTHSRVILVGSDCPVLCAGDLRRAAALLRACPAVLAPAEDGGYPLIGLSRWSATLFEGIAWGSDCVFRQTRERLDALGWRWRALRTLWDVDRPEDLARLRETGLRGWRR